MNLISSTRLVNNLATRGQTTQPLTNISVTIMDFNERFRDILFLNVATLLIETFFEIVGDQPTALPYSAIQFSVKNG